jgi:hypothetical protein
MSPDFSYAPRTGNLFCLGLQPVLRGLLDGTWVEYIRSDLPGNPSQNGMTAKEFRPKNLYILGSLSAWRSPIWCG